MPQHLTIEVEGVLVGRLTTYNKGGTRYDVTLCVPELGLDAFCPNEDTGEQRQPQAKKAQAQDFENDFIHARRCIAGAVQCSGRFLRCLQGHAKRDCPVVKPIVMRLTTNDRSRGTIDVEPIDDASFTVNVAIGDRTWNYTGIELDVSGTASQTARALEILKSIGYDLLEDLPEGRSAAEPTHDELSRMLEAGLARVHDADLLSSRLDRASDSDAQLRILGFEILLKCAIGLYGKRPKGTHVYHKLWCTLPDHAQKEILSSAKDRMPGHTDFSDLKRLLMAYQRVFIDARYPYEEYEGWSADEVRQYEELWVSLGAQTEDADFQYYPNELACLTDALETFIRKRLSK